MAALTDVWVPVRPDMKTFEPDMKRRLRRMNADSEGRRIGGSIGKSIGSGMRLGVSGPLKNMAGLMASAFAAVKVGGFLKDAITQASDLNETVSKTRNIFGSSSGSIEKFASTSAKSLGLSRAAALDGLSTFGNFFNQIHIGTGESVKMSKGLVRLSADLGSFNNADPAQVMEAFQSATRGEYDALQRFIPTVSAATVQAEALRLTHKKSVKDLTDADKATALYAIAQRDAGKAQGDFARTSGGLANQQRILSAQFSNFKASIGAIALPLVTKLFTFLNTQGVPALNGIGRGIRTMITGFQSGMTPAQGFGKVIGTVGVQARFAFEYFRAEVLPRLRQFGTFLGKDVLPRVIALAKWIGRNRDFFIPFAATIVTLIAAVKTWIAVQTVLNFVLAANPVGLVIVAVAALVGGLVMAYKRSETFRKIVNTAFQVVALAGRLMWERTLKPTFRFMVNAWLTAAGVILHGAALAFGWVPGVGPKLRGAARQFDLFKSAVNRSLDNIHDEKVNLTAKFNNQLPRTLYGVRVGGGVGSNRGGITATMATGGGVFGGSGTRDDVPALLQGGEHVWTKREVAAAGGHGAVEAMRKSVLQQYAAGGAVFRVSTSRPRDLEPMPARVNLALGRAANEIGLVAAKAITRSLMSSSFNPGLAGGLNFAKRQSGKPYIWGGVGPRGYDCSGFMSAILNVVQGKNPYHRRFATGNFPTAGFIPGPGAFMIGSRRGNPGHMAGTINGVNVESSGSIGAHYGRSARGARNSMFTGLYHLKGYARGGRVGDGPWDMLDPNGREFLGDDVRRAIFGREQLLDSGGWIPTGRSVVNNRTGKPEWVPPPGSAGATYNITINTPGLVGMTKQDLRNGLVQELESLRTRRRI